MGDNQSITTLKNKDNNNQQEQQTPNPFVTLFTNFTNFFNLPPPPKSSASNPDTKVVEPAAQKTQSNAPVVVVAFPNKQTVAPLKLESEDLQKDTNPVVLWQVYAIGGFFVLKWAWARWNERRAKKKTNDEDPPPADE